MGLVVLFKANEYASKEEDYEVRYSNCIKRDSHKMEMGIIFKRAAMQNTEHAMQSQYPDANR